MSAMWLPVVGYEERYEVSDTGIVRRIDTHRPLSQYLSKTGAYPEVKLSRDGRTRTTRVHRIVALAFHGQPAPGHEVRHLDGDRTNNNAENLKWGTKSENRLDSVRHGTHYSHGRHVTHCPQGHEYTPENTRRSRNGKRHCKRCHLDRQIRRRAAAKSLDAIAAYDPEELLPGYTPPVFAPITPVDDWKEPLP